MKVNGQEIPLTEALTLQAFLERQGYDIKKVAVERNGSISPKNSFHQALLQPEDVLEIVSFVGGG